MKEYKTLTCEELINTIKELKAELESRTRRLTWDQTCRYEEDEGMYCMIKTLEHADYLLFPEIDKIYVYDD